MLEPVQAHAGPRRRGAPGCAGLGGGRHHHPDHGRPARCADRSCARSRSTARRAAGSRVIRVNARIRYQRITGFGAAMTDSSAWLLYDELAPAWREATMNDLFGPEGLRLNFVRIPMAASDYTVSSSPYSYDDPPSGRPDPTLADFSIAHDEAYIIPALKEMLAINPGRVHAGQPVDRSALDEGQPHLRQRGAGRGGAAPGLRGARAVLRQVHRGLSVTGRADRRDHADERAELGLHMAGLGAHAGRRRHLPAPVPGAGAVAPRAFTRRSSATTTPSWPTPRRCSPAPPPRPWAGSPSTATRARDR